MLGINFPGGTHAGWRVLRIRDSLKDWKCPNCGARNRYYWVKCPVCAHPRDAD